jgi:uncharacterized RDD family membrane protein YckC
MASADYSVLTPERVNLEYGIAGIGSRGAAAIVDTISQAIVLTVVLIAVAFGIGASGLSRQPVLGNAIALAVLLLAVFVISNGYFVLFEIVWNGQTPGKRLVGLRVIRESGYPIRPIDAVIRNVVRIVDWLPLFYAVGVLVMLLNKRSRRLGDFASGTIVVREGSRGSLSNMPLQQLETGLGVTLSSSDATLVRDFLVRRRGMHPRARADLARRLAQALSQRYHLPLDPDTEPERFLERLSP